VHRSPEKPKTEAYKLTSPFSLNIPRCRHLKVNGTQCGSPALKDHRFCFFHQQWHERKLVINSSRARKGRASITLPVLEDANAIQLSVMQIMQMLLSGQIEQKTAGLLFYGLQIASSNLKHTNFEPETKNEIVIDPKKTAETRLGQPLWKNGDFEETADGKINLDDYDLTDLTIRVIDQMKKQSGMEPTPRSVRERYAPWTCPNRPPLRKRRPEKKRTKPRKRRLKPNAEEIRETWSYPPTASTTTQTTSR
jgi:hypothetical protein